MFKTLFFKMAFFNLIILCFFCQNFGYCQDAVSIHIDFDSTKKWKVNDTIPVRLTIKNDSNKAIAFINFDGRFQRKNDICLGFYLTCLPERERVFNEIERIWIPKSSDYVRLKSNRSKSFNFKIIPFALNEALITTSKSHNFIVSIQYCDKVLKRRNSIKFLPSEAMTIRLEKI